MFTPLELQGVCFLSLLWLGKGRKVVWALSKKKITLMHLHIWKKTLHTYRYTLPLKSWNKWWELQSSLRGFLKVRQTDALRQFNFISACWNWYSIKKMPARGWVSAEWREGRRLPRPVLWREQLPIPDRGLALYPPNMGKLLRSSLPHPRSQSLPVHRHLAQISNISRAQPRSPKNCFINSFFFFSSFFFFPSPPLVDLIAFWHCDRFQIKFSLPRPD